MEIENLIEKVSESFKSLDYTNTTKDDLKYIEEKLVSVLKEIECINVNYKELT